MAWNIGNQLRPPRRRTVGERVMSAIGGLVFLAFGCGFLYLILLRPLGQSIVAGQWVATPARVVSCTVQSGRKATYSVAIRYTYTVNNQRYESSRYAFIGGSSSGHDDKAAIVRQHPPGSELTCYVDPHDPSAAVIERGLQPIMWFALLPGLFAAIGIFSLVVAFRKVPAPAPTSVAWQNRKDWADGRIKSTVRRNFVMTSVFAVIWNAFSWTMLFVTWREVARTDSPAKWIMLLFPTVGVGLLGAAVYSWLKWLKFGNAMFEMANVPGVLGGVVEGTIKLGRLVRFPEGVTVRLCCVRQITTAGEDSSTSTLILWESERHLPDTGGTDSIPVLFAIPADARETDGTNPRDQILWRLAVAAKLPGVDLAEIFIVPVCQGTPTPVQAAAVQRARAAEVAELAHYERPVTSRIRVQTIVTGTEFYFPAARNPGVGAGLTLFTVLWSGIIFYTVQSRVPVFVRIVMGLVGVGSLIAVVNLWLGTTRVIATTTGFMVVRRLAGIPRRWTVTGNEIDTIIVKPGMTAGTTVYHDIKICLKSGTKITAGSSIRDYQEAKWLAGEMARSAAVTYRP